MKCRRFRAAKVVDVFYAQPIVRAQVIFKQLNSNGKYIRHDLCIRSLCPGRAAVSVRWCGGGLLGDRIGLPSRISDLNALTDWPTGICYLCELVEVFAAMSVSNLGAYSFDWEIPDRTYAVGCTVKTGQAPFATCLRKPKHREINGH